MYTGTIHLAVCLLLILYSTGNPKGAIITHGNVVSNLAGAYMQMVREGGERKREGKAGRDDAGINFFLPFRSPVSL